MGRLRPAGEQPAAPGLGQPGSSQQSPAATLDAPAADPGRPAGRPSRARLAWIGAYVVAGVVLFLCYLRVSGTQPISSDGGSNALEAWDMLHGNLLLHGWTLTDVSFYTTELPEYMAGGADPRAGPGRGAHRGRRHLHAAGPAGRPAGQGPRHRPGGRGPGADRLRHHAGASARQPRLRPARGARPRGHRRSPAAHLPGPGPRAAALVRAAGHRADAGLGHRRRPAGDRRRHPADRGGVRCPDLPGRGAGRPPAGRLVVRGIADRLQHRRAGHLAAGPADPRASRAGSSCCR